MSALTENYDPQGKAGALVSYPVAGSTHIYKGALVCVNSSGYGVPGADTADYIFIGVAYEECNNSTGSDGDRRVRVLKTGSFLYAKDSSAQSDVGDIMYISDDQTVASSTTNSIPAGYVVEVPDSSHVRTRIDTQVK